MRKQIMITVCIGALALTALSGCNKRERAVAGGLAGAAAGLITANALGANPNWTLLAVLGGAAAGTMVAKNTNTGLCAYARGDGTYYKAPCP